MNTVLKTTEALRMYTRNLRRMTLHVTQHVLNAIQHVLRRQSAVQGRSLLGVVHADVRANRETGTMTVHVRAPGREAGQEQNGVGKKVQRIVAHREMLQTGVLGYIAAGHTLTGAHMEQNTARLHGITLAVATRQHRPITIKICQNTTVVT